MCGVIPTFILFLIAQRYVFFVVFFRFVWYYTMVWCVWCVSVFSATPPPHNSPSGPPMRALGDKIGSTIIAQSAGVPTIAWNGDGLKVGGLVFFSLFLSCFCFCFVAIIVGEISFSPFNFCFLFSTVGIFFFVSCWCFRRGGGRSFLWC